ncbi:MAG TPA: hypothetical protein DIC64_04565 [Alphaproteobacteria bacterium]|nr:hypothetical protein [Alphaproteobacteria bacterium]
MSEQERKIPQFLEDGEQAEMHYDVDASPKPLKKTLLALGAFWVIGVFVYLQFLYGWSNLSALMPADFVVFLAAFFIFPLVIFFLIVWVKKTYSTLKQNEMVEQSLGRFLKTKDENLLSKIINKALQNQIEELNSTLQFLSAQTDTLKNELNTKAQDFHDISQTLDNVAKQNLARIDENKNEYIELCRELSTKAQETASQLKTHTDELKESADGIYQQLNPLIDETMVTADHLKNMVEQTQGNMAQTKTDLAEFADMSKNSMAGLAEMLKNETSQFEQAMLRTSDSCQEIYKKIDSGISYIENSLKTHKALASEQAQLLDKNSSFLDGKLGEYGKLISMEVAAMVERADNLDMNVKGQISKLQEAGAQISSILEGANNSLSLKSERAIQNIEAVVNGLAKEVEKISGFINQTELKNVEMQKTAEKMSGRIGSLSADLSLKTDDLRLRAVDAIDKFNEVSAVLEKNTIKLSENANMLVSKSKQGAEFISTQQVALMKTSENFETMKKQIKDLEENIGKAQQKSVQVFQEFQKQMTDYQHTLDTRFKELEDQKTKSERHLREVKTQYQELGLSGFMDKMSQMVQDLENLSIDLNRFFDKDSEDDLWKKFYNGDHAAFAHNMVKKLGRKEILKIRDQYEKNADFHELADRYLNEFETLLNAAEKSDKPETMLAIISGSEIGKIYYVMARALDKLG